MESNPSQTNPAPQPKAALPKEESFAEVIENKYPWDTGAPLPHVISDGCHTYLAYILADRASALKEQVQQVTVLRQDEHSYNCALLHFESAVDYRFGGVNDEVLGFHPLKGLDYYELHEVHHSQWIAELKSINANHFCYAPLWWQDLKHYYFTFHDQTFECLAKGFSVELYHGYIHDVMKVAFERMFT